MTAPAGVAKLTTHELTPRARKAIRMGLELLKGKHETAGRPLRSLDDQRIADASKVAIEYVDSLAQEFVEPGSAEAVAADQLHLIGEEGPFRKDLYDLKGRPDD